MKEPAFEATLLLSLAEVVKALPRPNLDATVNDEIFLEGSITAYHKDGFVVGRFIVEDSWWMFYPGEAPTT